ncbi:MAG: Maf family protein [Clostridium sp.]
MHYTEKCGDNMNIILASASPRRKEIMNLYGLDYKVIPSNADEDIDIECPYEMVKALASKKAQSIAVDNKDDLVIGADTIVYLDGKILGKPSSEEDAFKILKSLSGKSHEVVTGVSLICKNKNISISDYEVTKVYFKCLTDEEIQFYIDSKEPLDKAGSYGIQGIGSVFVEKIEGCYFNVVGLPVNKLYNLLGRIGVNLLERK